MISISRVFQITKRGLLPSIAVLSLAGCDTHGDAVLSSQDHSDIKNCIVQRLPNDDPQVSFENEKVTVFGRSGNSYWQIKIFAHSSDNAGLVTGTSTLIDYKSGMRNNVPAHRYGEQGDPEIPEEYRDLVAAVTGCTGTAAPALGS